MDERLTVCLLIKLLEKHDPNLPVVSICSGEVYKTIPIRKITEDLEEKILVIET